MSRPDKRLPGADALGAWVAGQRWFGAKSRRITGIALADAVPLGPGVVVLADVELAGAEGERYALPLLPGDDVRDALDEPAFCRALLALVVDDGATAGTHGEIRGRPAAGLAERWPGGLPAGVAARRLGGEQSNTSVVLGEALVLKHFRKLAWGLNPDAEMGRFLAERTDFANAPRFGGHLEYRGRDGRVTTLAVLHALVADGVDGWRWVLARLGDGPGRERATAALGRLGQRTGELHRALATSADDPAFAPEPITAADVDAWADAVGAQLEAARAALAERELAVDHARIRAGLGHLTGRLKIRHHGDFHLGQTLYRPEAGDWMIIDFEGEPLRPLEERRRKHAALRDVAGLLRSIDYAAASAADDSASAGRWAEAAATAFLEGYRSATGGAPFLPAALAEFREVVAVFELEKAAYEVVYEANHRPDWIAIPTRGLREVARRLSTSGSTRRAPR